ncbi:MAG: acyloxyacyl hydrolase [Zoogloea sp.]|nr:acyloxyacyl hydrolase [Zoogloea sp.]
MKALVLAAGLLAASLAQADDKILSLRVGSHDSYGVAGIGMNWPVAVVDRDGWHATGEVELQLGQIRATGGIDDGDRMGQAGAFINLRAAQGNAALRPYFEVGAGGNLFSQVHLGGKQFSSAFQFGEHLGIGMISPDQHWLAGVRYAHYSNANIQRPNDGLDLYQVLVGFTF